MCSEVIVKDPTTTKHCCCTTLRCIDNYYVNAVFLTLMFRKVVYGHVSGVVGYFIIFLLVIYRQIYW